MNRKVVLPVVVVLVLSGCSALGIVGSVAPNEWWVTGTTPDGQQLLVTSMFGGVASDCSRWEGWEIDSSDDQVEIIGHLWRKQRPSGCTDDGASSTLLLELDAPLGDRTLEGCQRDDCRAAAFPEWLDGDADQVVASGESVVISHHTGLTAIAAGGAPLWERSGVVSGRVLATSEVVVAADGAETVALAVSSGDVLWRSVGHPVLVADGVVITCEDEQILGLDATTGDERWSVTAPCGPAAVSGDTVAMVVVDREVDGGHELVMFDVRDGKVETRRELDDGVDDQVAAFSGVLAAGDRFVVAGSQADTVVLDMAGTELRRTSSAEGHPIGVVEGVAVLVTHDTVTAVDIDGTELWSQPTTPSRSWSVAGSALLRHEGPVGELSRIGSRTGQPTWTSQVGASTDLAAAATGPGGLYVRTVLALLHIDLDSGEIISWSPMPPPTDEVITGE